MRKSAILLGLFASLISLNGMAQKAAKKSQAAMKTSNVPQAFVFTFGKDTVYKPEFLRQLNKNRKETGLPSEAELNDYLNLYINFKLKVKEAIAMQLDTNPSFKSELAGYRRQLTVPYMSDKKVTEALMAEAYERMKSEVNGSHILINVGQNASPADTLAAWNKIADLRKRILKGEAFDSIAFKYSEDPSAKRNYGTLGWFTAFQMVYPFENVAYQLNVGDISMPFRTQFGYHIMKLNNKRANRGEVKVQHIMIRTGIGSTPEQIADAKLVIDSAYLKIQNGANFEQMVEQYSQDEGSKANKGNMNWMASLSGFPDVFKDIAFGLQTGELSKPFATDFGWHLIKLLEKRPLGTYKEVQDIVKSKVSRDTRSESSKAAVITRVKKEGNFSVNEINLKYLMSKLDTGFMKGVWEYDSAKIINKTLFTIGNKSHGTREFGSYLQLNQKPLDKGNVQMVARNMFNDWASEKCLAYEESMLESKYEDFRNIMQEYHDGILLFDLTDRKVWGKAMLDTLGLEQFYNANKSKYMWKERLEYRVYTCLDAKNKAAAMKMLRAGKSEMETLQKLNKKIVGTLSSKSMKSEQSDPTASKLWEQTGVVDIQSEDGSHKFYYIIGKVAAEPKELKEAKGLVTSDYQDVLMNDWIKELRAKYEVQINQQTLKTLHQ